MIKKIDIAREFDKFDEMVGRLRAPQQSWNINKVQPWHTGFRKDIQLYGNNTETQTKRKLYPIFQQFLHYYISILL